jgi:hypothetical protein
MDDHFENLDNWNYEVQMGGFGYVLELIPRTYH